MRIGSRGKQLTPEQIRSRIVAVSISTFVIIAAIAIYRGGPSAFLSLLKYISLVVASLGTLLGISYKTTDDTGATRKILPPGRWAIGLTIVGLLVGFGSNYLDGFVTAQKEAKSNAEHQAETAGLKKQLAEQKMQELVNQGKIDSGRSEARAQSNLLSVQQKDVAKQLELEQKLQAQRTRYEQHEQAAQIIRKQDEISERELSLAIHNQIASLNKVVAEANRVIHPIKDVVMSYIVELPIQMPAMHDYSNQLKQAITRFEANGEDTTTSPDFNRVDVVNLSTGSVLSKVLVLRPGGPLYPTDTNTLIRCLTQYRITMSFWKSAAKANTFIRNVQVRDELFPDCRFDTANYEPFAPNKFDTPEISYSVTTGKLFANYNNIIPNGDFYTLTTHDIETLPDMIGSTVYAYRRGTIRSGNIDVDHRIDSLLPHCSLRILSMAVSGKKFLFADELMKHSQDRVFGDACTFTFQSIFDMSQPSNRKRISDLWKDHGGKGHHKYPITETRH